MKVYVAGPYSQGDTALNVRAAIEAADELAAAGHVPYVPHLTHLWHLISPKPYGWWVDYDTRWLALCDAVLRLPGDSVGADHELDVARRYGITIYEQIGDIPPPGSKGWDEDLPHEAFEAWRHTE